MSLFAAYADKAEASQASGSTMESSAWLQNSSFTIDVIGNKILSEKLASPESSHGTETKKAIPERKRKKSPTREKKKKRKKLKHRESIHDNDDEDGFLIDTHRTKEFLSGSVKTISRPAAPRYRISFYCMKPSRRIKRKLIRRYYQNTGKDSEKDEVEVVITKHNINDLRIEKPDENFTGFKQEEDLSSATAAFNRSVNEDPGDINMWLKYVSFQDVVSNFEKTYRKGSIAKGLRVLAERKLSILDKALSHNPDNEQLLRERLNVAVAIYPADELQAQLKILVEKEQGNIILWQGYIEATQCSMSHCNTPAVLALYTKCLSILHKLRRTATMEKALLEESIMNMLYQCGLFLKQAGLAEQLWTLLRLYLELNLSPNDKTLFNISLSLQEKQLLELEEVVFNSQLPLHELWLRTEKLRESCRWLPYTGDGECEDPQRLVFPEDVAELIHPITTPENIFKLTAIILTLLKVPLLPCRHSTMQDLGLDHVPWALDSIETLLPIFTPLHGVDTSSHYLVIDNRLSVGPQYLKALPGQEEYLQFVLLTMRNCAECMSGDDKIALIVWWMRFQRLLIALDSKGGFSLPKNFQKRIKTNVKNLLKQEGNRNNVLFYVEYALIEYEMGNAQSCFNILQTALTFTKNAPVASASESSDQTERCYLHRLLVELYLKDATGAQREKNTDLALKLLTSCALGRDYASSDDLAEAKLKFKHVTLQLLQRDTPRLSVVRQFFPHFLNEWIMCNGWFLYVTEGPTQCFTFLEDVLSRLDEKHADMLWQKETLQEFYVALVFKHCTENPGFGFFKTLDEALNKAIGAYPNNLFLLSVLAKEQSITSATGTFWWKLKGLLIKTARALPILFLVLIANQQIVKLQQTIVETTTGQKYELSDSLRNRMLSLFRFITRPDMCTRRCGLVWRLYLQFVHAYFDPALCRNVYYCAVEECPWLKALYIDAGIYIPAELAQIQDLLIEKQLRLHVTPEELDVLRN